MNFHNLVKRWLGGVTVAVTFSTLVGWALHSLRWGLTMFGLIALVTAMWLGCWALIGGFDD